MRLHVLSEGTAASELGDIAKFRNSLAQRILLALDDIGFRKPNLKPSEGPSDDVIIYIEAGKNAILSGSQIIMIAVEDDDRIRIQIPSDISGVGKKTLADILGIDDFYTVGSAGEAIARLKSIKNKIDALINKNGLRGTISTGHIGESQELDLAKARMLLTRRSNGYYTKQQIDDIANIMINLNCHYIHACVKYGKQMGLISRYTKCGCPDCVAKPKQQKLF